MTGGEPLLLGPRGNRFAPSGFFALRTTLLPFETFESFGKGLAAPSAPDTGRALAKALACDRESTRALLRALVQRPDVREAIFIASPGLEERLAVWMDDPESKRGAGLEAALFRYVVRMSTRPTPFGLSAGVTAGSIGPHTRLVAPAPRDAVRHTRLDAQYLAELAASLERDPVIRADLRYTPNTSLYEIAGQLRYAAARLRGGRRSYHLVAIEPSEYLLATLERAEKGETIEILAAALAGGDVSIEEARDYVNELVDEQILVSDLEPPVTGDDMMAAFRARLALPAGAAKAAALFSDVHERIRAMDAEGVGVATSRYHEVARALETLPAEVDVGRLFQVDLVSRSGESTLGSKVLVEVGRVVEMLRRLEVAVPDALDRFRGRFRERYGDQEVPLVEALDEEIGIGFETSGASTNERGPLLEGLVFPAVEDPVTSWRPLHTYLLDRIAEADPDRSLEVLLDPRDLERLVSGPGKPLPGAIQVKGCVVARDEEAVRQGDFRVVVDSVAGPSGARVLGRFCHASPEIRAGVERHLREEEALEPDAIFAEIAHLPEGRLGNILFRPVLRAHEIPYLGRSSVASERRIPVTDLVLALVDDRIVLRSRRLGKEIRPRLASAHNFAQGSLGLYRFLCSLQHEGSAVRLLWEWGALGTAPFLPRIVFGRAVLSRASWTVKRDELEALGRTEGAERYRTVQRWREKRKLPRYVSLSDADNRLLLDLENIVSIDAFVPLVKKRQRAVLVEMYPGPDELVARGQDGRFVHEFVVPFVRVREKTASVERAPVAQEVRADPKALSVPRRFPPGSAWLTAKLYAGSSTADVVLRDLVLPLVRAARDAGEIDRWFFLRYADPDVHLRVRFHGEPSKLSGQLLARLHDSARPFLEDERIFRIQLDTYDREVERYGGPDAIEIAEAVFEADSDAALALVTTLAGDEGADARWRAALLGVHELLIDLGLDDDARRGVARNLEAGYQAEFRADSNLRKGLGARFSAERVALERLFWEEPSEGWPKTVRAIVAQRSLRIRPFGERLRELEESGALLWPRAVLASSFAHMHVNRVLRSAHRAQEVVLYTLLHRLYVSRSKRGADQGSKP